MKLIHTFSKFTLIGAISSVAHFGILITLVEWFAVNPILASIAGFCSGAIVNYNLNRNFTFKSNAKHKSAILKFLTIAIVGVNLNTLIMWLVINSLHLHYFIAQIIAAIFVLFWNFSFHKLWVFKN
jgi:putative flippase GtrA